MTVNIPDELEPFVQEALASGQYRTQEELIVDAVRVLRELRGRHDQLRRDVEAAIAQGDRGESRPLDVSTIKREGRQRLADRAEGR